jgi:sulfite reductase alpha subunit-like flavoprotein
MIRQNPSKFQIARNEIKDREGFISSTRSRLNEIRELVGGKATLARMEADKQSMLAAANDPRRSAIDQANQRFVSNQQSQQQMIMQHQDNQLDELARCTERLNENATVINVELQEQARMLDQLETDLDRETERMNFVMKRMGKLLKTSDTGQLYTIVCLMGVLSFLLFLIFFT